jgi:hypothetical protein
MTLPCNSQKETVKKTVLAFRIPKNSVNKSSHFRFQHLWGMSVQDSNWPQRVGAQDSRNAAMSLLYTQSWNPVLSTVSQSEDSLY